MQLFNTHKLRNIQAQEQAIKKHAILVVDDEVANRKVITSILQYEFIVLEASNGVEAIEIVQKHPNPESISMVISDQRMPHMSGVELLSHLAKIIPKSVRIIVSGYTDVESLIGSINKANIYKFIIKPFERADFLWTIERALENFELQQKHDAHLLSLEYMVAERTKELADKNIKLEQAYKKLEDISLTDPLTQLKNRRYLDKHIDANVAQSLEAFQNWQKDTTKPLPHNEQLTFFMLDLDNFKSVNDIYGHEFGDEVLKSIKPLLETLFRSSDIFIRLGGEEFLIVVRDINQTDAQILAERLRKTIKQYVFVVNSYTNFTVTCSIGYVQYPYITEQPNALSWQQVVKLTDKALYLAKNNGRDAWVGLSHVNNNINENEITKLLDPDEILTQNNTINLVSNITLTIK